MRFAAPIGLSSAVWYPGAVTTPSEAIAAGVITEKEGRQLGYDQLPVSEEHAPPQMAINAADALLTRRCVARDQITLLAHASVHFQGHIAWSTPHHVASSLGLGSAVPLEVLQQCNGGAIAIELAIDHVRSASRAHGRAALVTTADRFFLPSWDRWATDYGMAAGDVATAVLVRPKASPDDDLWLRSMATVAAPDLELMHRGTDGWVVDAEEQSRPISVRRTKRAFIAERGLPYFNKVLDSAITQVVEQALTDASMRPRDLVGAVIPRLGSKAMADSYLPPLLAVAPVPLVDLGRQSGHIGAGDFNANIAEVTSVAGLLPGQSVLVLNGGGGFTFTAAVVSVPDA